MLLNGIVSVVVNSLRPIGSDPMTVIFEPIFNESKLLKTYL